MERIKIKNKRIPDPTYVAETKARNNQGQPMGEWRCHCGNHFFQVNSRVTSGHKRTCGCSSFTPKYDVGEVGRMNILLSYKRNASGRGLTWELTDDMAYEMFAGVCHFCNKPPSNYATYGKAPHIRDHNGFTYSGIDKLDNSVGYTIENSVPCCKECNFMKSSHTEEAYIKHCMEVAKKWAGKV